MDETNQAQTEQTNTNEEQFTDKELSCKTKECGKKFTLTAKEQQWFYDKKLFTPSHCKKCIAKKRAEKAAKEKTTKCQPDVTKQYIGRFHWDSHHNCWLRVLGPVQLYLSSPIMSIAEVNLEEPETYAMDVSQANVKIHCDSPATEDRFVDSLPELVVEDLIKAFGQETADYLLNHDILSDVEISRWIERHDQGGCYISECSKEGVTTFPGND
jgi:hypothetical protein